MGPVGMPEMVVIFLLALVLFGPKKLPELGRTVGKAIKEFRRAQSELKATFDREMQNLERETELSKEVTSNYQYDNYNYDYSSGDSSYEPYIDSAAEPQDSTVTNTSTNSASATEGAESLSPVTPEGVVPHGTESISGNGHAPHESATPDPAGAPGNLLATSGSLTAEHNA